MRAISPTHADGYMQLFPLYILPLFNIYRNANNCASRVMQLYDSQPIIYSANESLNAITSVLLFTFLLMARNNPLLLREQKSYGLLTSKLVGLFVYCVNLCHVCMYHTLLYYRKKICALFHSYWLMG